MLELVNPFKTEPNKRPLPYQVYEVPVYVNGDYAIHRHYCMRSHLYSYKGVVFNELVGLNIEHMENVVNRVRPMTGHLSFLYDRAIENISSYWT